MCYLIRNLIISEMFKIKVILGSLKYMYIMFILLGDKIIDIIEFYNNGF